jgi:hypothetical protein
VVRDHLIENVDVVCVVSSSVQNNLGILVILCAPVENVYKMLECKNLMSRRTNDIWIPAAARPQTLGLSPIYKRRFKIDRKGFIYQEFGCHHTGYDERYCMCSQKRTQRRKSTSVAFSFCYKLSVFFGLIVYSRSLHSKTELDKSNLLKRTHLICI